MTTTTNHRTAVTPPFGHRSIALAGVAIAVGLAAGMFGGCENTRPRSIATLDARGEWALERGDYERAEEAYAEIVQRVPGNRDAHHGLGRALLAQGDALPARRHLEIAYQHAWDSPNEDFAYEVAGDLAEAMHATGDADRMFTFLRERMQATGAMRDYLRWGDWSLRSGDPDTAQVAYLTAARIDTSGSAAPYLQLATLHEQLGDTEAATYRLRQAYGLEPENPEVQTRLRQYVTVIGPTVALPPEQGPLTDIPPATEAEEDAERRIPPPNRG